MNDQLSDLKHGVFQYMISYLDFLFGIVDDICYSDRGLENESGEETRYWKKRSFFFVFGQQHACHQIWKRIRDC